MIRRLLLVSAVLFGLVSALGARDDYPYGPDSQDQPGVPRGEVTQFKHKSEVFANTVREVWVYVPAQYDGKEPASVMVFQDGASYVIAKGDFKTTTVFDNLIHKKKMPVTIGIFIDPGVFPDKIKVNKKGKMEFESNRSFEYDTLSPQYATFLETEILPEVGKNYKLREDAAGRAIGGISSGGICAFTVAWERPDLFSKVLSHVGSFQNIRGGDRYPGMIRKTEKKNIRVFLQDGTHDLDNNHGNWWLGNLAMEASLQYKKYDHRTAWGDGGHDGKHGGAIMPESLVWLWRGDAKN
jgi:enterochelin esterase-like enzyme